jgi:hypothetical protein
LVLCDIASLVIVRVAELGAGADRRVEVSIVECWGGQQGLGQGLRLAGQDPP